MDKIVNHCILVGDESDVIWNHFQSVFKAVVKDQSSTISRQLDLPLETKYYTTNIRLISFEDLRSCVVWRTSNKEFDCKSFCISLKKSQTTYDLARLESLSDLFEFDTKIITCYQSCLPPTFANALLLWANRNGFEVIDLEPDEADIEYFKSNNERFGLDRIVEVLEGTEWTEKKNKKNPLSHLTRKSEIKENSDESSEEEFEGELGEDDKKFLEELLGGSSIIDYYSGRGFNFNAMEGELSQIEEQEIMEKKAKQRARKKAKAKSKKKEGEEVSDDVGIELDKDEPSGSQKVDVETQLKPMGIDNELGILGQLNDLRNKLANQPHEVRVKNAELITSLMMKALDDED